MHANKKLLIDIDNVSVAFEHEKALNDVSLCIHKSEFIGIIGPNGAGKTTLLRVVLGLLKPTKGRVTLTTDSKIGYIPQGNTPLDSTLPFSVLEVVKLGSRGATPRAIEALETVKMASAMHKRFSELSGGEAQRVVIAKALASNPTILVLDEPTTGIDERSQTDFFTILQMLQQKNITIIMVSHDIDAVLRQVTRVICLNHTVVYDGPPEHFEADKYLPILYNTKHRLLHHHHGEPNA